MPEPSELPPDVDSAETDPANSQPEADGELAAVDAYRRLDEIDALVSGARSMPMSGVCVVNRGELRQLVSEVRTALPVELGHARWLLERRAEIVADGTRQAEQLVETARQEQARLVEAGGQEQARLVGESEVLAGATRAAAELTAEAEQDAARMRAETDDYAERKLAALEETLHQALAAVRHGRQTLAERSPERRPPERSTRAQ